MPTKINLVDHSIENSVHTIRYLRMDNKVDQNVPSELVAKHLRRIEVLIRANTRRQRSTMNKAW